MHKKKILWVLVILTICIIARDISIQSERNDYVRLCNLVDNQIAQYEAENIDINSLRKVSRKQPGVVRIGQVLLDLNIPERGSVNRYSASEVSNYNSKIESYTKNSKIYVQRMSKLNSMIGIANQTYEVNPINEFSDLYRYVPKQKFFEYIGLSSIPEEVSLGKVTEMRTRFERQIMLREEWNAETGKINSKQNSINRQREMILKLYGAEEGMNVEEAQMVRSYD